MEVNIAEGYTILQDGHEVQSWTPDRVLYLYTIVTPQEIVLDVRTFDPRTGKQTGAQKIRLK